MSDTETETDITESEQVIVKKNVNETDDDDKIDYYDGDVSEDEFDDKKCLYKYIDQDSDDDDFDYDMDGIDDDIQVASKNVVPQDKRISKPRLTKYERVRIIGDRAKQIALGAKVMLKNVENMSPKEIALTELKEKTLPIIIFRKLPNNKIEKWFLSELSI